jgi:hypothetical protein
MYCISVVESMIHICDLTHGRCVLGQWMYRTNFNDLSNSGVVNFLNRPKSSLQNWRPLRQRKTINYVVDLNYGMLHEYAAFVISLSVQTDVYLYYTARLCQLLCNFSLSIVAFFPRESSRAQRHSIISSTGHVYSMIALCTGCYTSLASGTAQASFAVI